MIDVLIGLSSGDCGKGRVADYLIAKNSYNIVARYGGGANAGHTVYGNKGNKHVLHMLPVGILHENVLAIIGHGCVVNPQSLIEELNLVSQVNKNWRLLIAEDAHIITPYHIDEECLNGEAERIGSTKKGITPCYRHKYNRTGIRMIDLLSSKQNIYNLMSRQLDFISYEHGNKESAQKTIEFITETRKNLKKLADEYFEMGLVLKPYIANDTEYILTRQAKSKILCEGAQGTVLDIDLGIYPFVSSSSSNIGGVMTGLGIPPKLINKVYGVFKGYTTKVGTGPFPTQMEPSNEELLRENGSEFGATTGRPRKIGWLDLPQIKYACVVNGVTDLVFTKLDVMGVLPFIKLGISYYDNQTNQIHTLHKSNLNYAELNVCYRTFPAWKSFLDTNRKVDQNAKVFINEVFRYLDESKLIKEKLHLLVSTGPNRNQIINWK